MEMWQVRQVMGRRGAAFPFVYDRDLHIHLYGRHTMLVQGYPKQQGVRCPAKSLSCASGSHYCREITNRAVSCRVGVRGGCHLVLQVGSSAPHAT